GTSIRFHPAFLINAGAGPLLRNHRCCSCMPNALAVPFQYRAEDVLNGDIPTNWFARYFKLVLKPPRVTIWRVFPNARQFPVTASRTPWASSVAASFAPPTITTLPRPLAMLLTRKTSEMAAAVHSVPLTQLP